MGNNETSQPKYQLLQIILTFTGTVLVAYFGYLSIKAQIDTPINATQTAKAEITTTNVDVTQTSTPLPPTNTAEPQPTETPVIAMPPSGWKNVMQDSFSDNQYVWEIVEDSDFRSYFLDGKYFLESASPEKDNQYFRNQPKNLSAQSSLYYGIDIKISSNFTKTACGIALRVTDLGEKKFGYYLFEINNVGEYRFRKINNANTSESEDLLKWSQNNLIKVNDTNRLTALLNGQSFEVYINNVLVQKISDQTFVSGLIGVVLHTDKQSEQGICQFDNSEVWVP